MNDGGCAFGRLLLLIQRSTVEMASEPDACNATTAAAAHDCHNVIREQGLPNQEHILACLALFEKEADVRVIFAAESSSRSIGTSHENSDHDIVAIYVHRRDRYFSMEKIPTAVKRAFPESTSPGGTIAVPEVEMVAWEARHAFARLADSTLALLDAFHSPLVYRAVDFTFPVGVQPKVVADWAHHDIKASTSTPPSRSVRRRRGTVVKMPAWVVAVQVRWKMSVSTTVCMCVLFWTTQFV